MEEEEEKVVDDVEDQDSLQKVPTLSGIPRPLSHSIGRPPSRPSPSARVHALSKEDLDVDQNSEDDEEDDDEEEDDDDQGIQIEGMVHQYSRLRRQKMTPPGYDRIFLTREQLSPERLYAYERPKSAGSGSLHLSEYSSSNWDDEVLSGDTKEKIDACRDMCYYELPYSHSRAYDPADFEHLQVSNEMKELFQYITRYTPQNIDLDTKLRPFIPEFIPAVGDIDAFIKVPRPDNTPDNLGLEVLDEPCAKQSDPTVLDLQLRAISKETTHKSVVVKNLENADKHPKDIDAWIDSISDLHRSKPPPTVHYSRNMPDIETLMQEWPPDVEQMLNEVGIPSADLDCSLEEYVELICGIMDIPVHRSKIQSLHVLFSLFSEFKNSQHFRSYTMNSDPELDIPINMDENSVHRGGSSVEPESLVIRD